jgi:hypothetical protein
MDRNALLPYLWSIVVWDHALLTDVPESFRGVVFMSIAFRHSRPEELQAIERRTWSIYEPQAFPSVGLRPQAAWPLVMRQVKR